MKNKNVALFTKIDLKPMAGEKFYVYALPDKTPRGIKYGVWVFRKGYGIAQEAYFVFEDSYELVSAEHIKELDDKGCFDVYKGVLLRYE